MTKQHEKILREICDKVNTQIIPTRNKMIMEHFLRGFLLSKEVLVAWFGNEDYEESYWDRDKMKNPWRAWHSWNYHGLRLLELNDISEMLTYYHKHRV